MDNNKYAVDEIIDNIVIIENIITKEKKEVEKDLLPINIYEGCILVEKNIYEMDLDEEEIRRNRIREKLAKLKE